MQIALRIVVGLLFLVAMGWNAEYLAADQPTAGAADAPAQEEKSEGSDAAGSSTEKEAPNDEAKSDSDQQADTEEPPVRVSLTRPVMTDEQRAEWASRLRTIYSQPSKRWPPPLVDRSVQWQELEALPEKPVVEVEPERVELGKLLFFEPRLSGSGQMACASCHDPDLNWADGRTVAIGNHRKALKRNAPTIMNVGFGKSHFWDGRAGTLEEQARQVLANPDEMDSSEEVIVDRISKLDGYRQLFQKVYGDETVSIDRVTSAIASFERTIVGGRSAFDKFMRGNTEELSDEAVIGLHLFRTEAHCMNCHFGQNFSDELYHDVGLSYYGRKYEDLGRFEITKEIGDVGRFKTPSLRNVAKTGPYMHNGLFPLDGVLNMYNAGMPTLRRKPHQLEDERFPVKSPLLHPLYFNRQDLAALKSFLESLSEPTFRIRPPELPQ